MNAPKPSTLDKIREAIRRGESNYVRQALDSGLDPNTQDSKGRTPLLYAAEFQNPGIVQLLLTYGADAEHRESTGYDASRVAAWHGEYRMGAYTEESQEIRAILKAHLEAKDR